MIKKGDNNSPLLIRRSTEICSQLPNVRPVLTGETSNTLQERNQDFQYR